MDRTADQPSPWPRRILEGAVIVVFLLLIWNNAVLRRQVGASAAPAGRHGFSVKDVIRTVPAHDLSGKPRVVDLQSGRTIVAIVDPRCESCRELVAALHGARGVQLISLAPPDETRVMAETAGLAASTSVLTDDAPARFHIYPQLFVVERGLVVRTCATVGECR